MACDFAGLINFNEHEKYTDALMRHLTAEPPPGFAPTSMDQILRADKEVFNHMGQNIADPRPVPGGGRPLDVALMTALQDYKTSFHLMPLPKTYGGGWHKSAGDANMNDDVGMIAREKERAKTKAREKVLLLHQKVFLIAWVVMLEDAPCVSISTLANVPKPQWVHRVREADICASKQAASSRMHTSMSTSRTRKSDRNQVLHSNFLVKESLCWSCFVGRLVSLQPSNVWASLVLWLWTRRIQSFRMLVSSFWI